MKYVVEHMEESVDNWVECEYKRIVADCGAANVIFTNMKPGVNCPAYDELTFLSGATLISESFEEFYGTAADKKRVCLLDEVAEKDLEPSDAGEFDYFLFGGILGNVDELDADRTKVLRIQEYSIRRLGKKQMTTPTAVCVTNLILEKQRTFETLEFIDRPEFDTDYDAEKLIMPFLYLKGDDGKPIMADGVLDILKSDLDWDLSDLQGEL
mgnify:FL=1|jgi:ribosome biogenesis SPOUT family RNA methylase Rps3